VILVLCFFCSKALAEEGTSLVKLKGFTGRSFGACKAVQNLGVLVRADF
jgi:hypothetical protein